MHLLREGNALLNVGFAVAAVGGSALAGLLISEFGLAVALLADAASFVVIAVVLALARDLPRPQGERQATLERFRSGLAFARRDPRVRLLLGGQSLALILFTLIIPIEVIYAKESLGTTSAGFGVLLAVVGRRHRRSAASSSSPCATAPPPAHPRSRPPRSASRTSGWPAAQSLLARASCRCWAVPATGSSGCR